MTDNQIVCLAPPSTVSGNVAVVVSLIGIDFAQTARCDTSCFFRYDAAYTPYIYEKTEAVAPGQLLAISGYLRGKYGGNYDVRINGKVCEPTVDKLDVVMSYTSAYGTLSCRVPDLPANRYNISLSVQHDAAAGLPSIESSVGYGLAVPDKYQWRAMQGMVSVAGKTIQGIRLSSIFSHSLCKKKNQLPSTSLHRHRLSDHSVPTDRWAELSRGWPQWRQ